LIRVRASWILPIDGRPIRDGWVDLDAGRIVALGDHRSDGVVEERNLGRVAVLPGLVNTHTHLELSYLRGKIPAARAFVDWVRTVVGARRSRTDPDAIEISHAVQSGIDEAVRAGTALVGDISNTLATFTPLARSSLAAVVFYELVRFRSRDASRLINEACRALDALAPTRSVRTGLAAHAPYSVAPDLFQAIRRAVDRNPVVPWSVHLAESREETEFIQSASGPWRAFLEEVQAWDDGWEPAGVSPVEYLDRGGLLDERVLAVHLVHADSGDLALLRARGATLVTCPRSNAHTGAGMPPLTAFYASGVRVAVGTDSLASTDSLSVFDELACMRTLAPSVPARTLLDSATRQGASALGFGSEFGSITPGKRARLIAVEIPDGTSDVEEYLVSGIHPEQVRWIDTPECETRL